MKRVALSLLGVFVAACGGGDAQKPAPAAPSATPVPVASSAPADLLGPRPQPTEAAPYTPPVPVSYTRESGLTVWLLERHTLPMVSLQIVVPGGAARDPAGKGGLAVTTAGMLDEGAGKRGALEIARDVDRLGATLETGAYADYGFARLTVLKKNLAPASTIFGDVVVRPTFSPVEYKRVHDLWMNGLKARQSEPDAVAGVVVSRKVYGPSDPYAHPADGTLASAAKVTIDDIKKFYGQEWRPDHATCVVVGDITRAELDPLLDQALAGWKKPAVGYGQTVSAPTLGGPTAQRVFVVDRPDAPQSVIAVARPGVSAFDEDSALLVRVNSALGGSFTSRLNQDLREEHGWTYGAHSRFGFTHNRSAFVAQAAVVTEHTGDALKAMLADVAKLKQEGLTPEEVAKTKQLARADLVEAFETVEAAVARLGRNAGVGQTPDSEAVKAKVTARSDKTKLDAAAASYLDLGASSIVVIVGPRAKLEPQLKAIGITKFETTGPEGE